MESSSGLLAEFQHIPPSAEGMIVTPLTDGFVWDPLWFNTARIPISAVPEPSPLALLTIGTTLLYGFRKTFGGRW